jgi:hypothetical protein
MIMEGYDFTDLTEQDIIFCEEYIIDFNATRAARAAGYGEHFKVNAYKKLQLDRIIKYIDFLKSKSAELAGVSLLRNAKELAKVAYGSAAALRSDWHNVKDWNELTDDEKAVLSDIKVTQKSYDVNKQTVFEETIWYKTHDKLKAIEILNKMFGYNSPEKLEHSGKNGAPIEITGMVIKKD